MFLPSFQKTMRGTFTRNLALTILGLAVVPLGIAADATKVKVLQSGKTLDLKSMIVIEAKVKAVATQDAEHPKVIEMVMDYATPGAFPTLGKTFGPGELKNYSAIRFWVRSDSGTGFALSVTGEYKRKDGKSTIFSVPVMKGSESWTQITIPFAKFTRHPLKSWDKKKGEPVILAGGDAMDELDLAGISRWQFTSAIERRGTSTVGQLMFDSIELVEK